MIEILLIIHLIVSAAMVGVVLLQKSEGGALGMGGGAGGFLTGRGTDNLLTRTTAGLAVLFFTTSLLLTVLPNLLKEKRDSRFNTRPAATGTPNDNSGSKTGGGVLDALKSGQGNRLLPSIPQTQ